MKLQQLVVVVVRPWAAGIELAVLADPAGIVGRIAFVQRLDSHPQRFCNGFVVQQVIRRQNFPGDRVYAVGQGDQV